VKEGEKVQKNFLVVREKRGEKTEKQKQKKKFSFFLSQIFFGFFDFFFLTKNFGGT
jgi:hypothetical protein